MAAPIYNRVFTQDITQKVETRHGGGLVFNGNNGSMTLGVRLYDGGEPLAPSGAVTGQVIRADGQTALTEAGTIEGNLVSVTLNQSCFAVEGPIVASISVTDGGVKTTVLRAAFTVALTSSGPVIDPGEVVPDVEDIVAQYGEMQRVTAAAKAAVGNQAFPREAMYAASAVTANPTQAGGFHPVSMIENNDTNKRRTGFRPYSRAVLFNLSSDTYKYFVWITRTNSRSTRLYSPSNGEWVQGATFIPHDGEYFRVCFARVDEADITDEDVTAMTEAINVTELTDKTLSVDGAIADAKAVGDLGALLIQKGLITQAEWEAITT